MVPARAVRANVAGVKTIDSEERFGLYAMGWFLWLAFLAFVLTGLLSTIREAPFIAVPFFGVFLFLAGKAALILGRKTGAYFNFGRLRLELQGEPAAVGGGLKGVIRFTRAPTPERIEAELVCALETQRRTPSGKLRTEQDVVLSEKSVVAMQRDGQGRFVEVSFAIPATASPSGELEAAEDPKNPPSHVWELRLKAPDPGGDLERTFPLEVLPPQARGTMAAPEAGSSFAASAALVAANLVPLALVLSGASSAGGLVVLYWAENVVIGFYAVLRMIKAARDTPADKIVTIAFFCGHYGFFCLIHGIFVVTLFSTRGERSELFSAMLLVPLLALFVSHGVSFVQNYVRNGRYLKVDSGESFWRPYPRILLLHVVIVAGGLFIARRGSPLPMLAGLVLGKTLIDLWLHRRANR
jgi:hypothetical protein